MVSVQRGGTLRVASSYRIVPEPVIPVLAGVVPIDLLAQERKHLFERRDEIERDAVKYEARELTLRHWQDR